MSFFAKRICRAVLCAAGVLALSAMPTAAQQIYDFSRMLAEPHPFTVAPPPPPAGSQYTPFPGQYRPPRAYPQPIYQPPPRPLPVAQPRRAAQSVAAPRASASPKTTLPASEPMARCLDGRHYRDYDPLWGVISEVRLGVSAHNFGPFAQQVEGGFDTDVELFLSEISWFDHWIKTPGGFWEWFLKPRPHFGLHYNSAGLTHQFWGGFGWTYLFNRRWFAEFTFGLDVHTGKLTEPTENRPELGSRVLFRESLAVGFMFGSGRNHNISIYLDHISHAGLFADDNEGMDNTGIRYGYRF